MYSHSANAYRIGIAYAGAYRTSLAELLLPLVADETLSMEVSSLAALSVGLIFVGSCNGEVAMTILQTMMERDEAALSEKWTRFMILGLALLYLGTLFTCALYGKGY